MCLMLLHLLIFFFFKVPPPIQSLLENELIPLAVPSLSSASLPTTFPERVLLFVPLLLFPFGFLTFQDFIKIQ